MSKIVRILNEHDLQELKFIADVHEQLPAGWIAKYEVNQEDIDKTFHRLITKQHANRIFCAIIEHEQKIISYIWAEISEKSQAVVDIMSLWTDEDYRRQGVATVLKIELEKWAKLQPNVKMINTMVSKKNSKMIELNEKLGYEINYYRMTKQL